MAGQLVPDARWTEIEPLFPQHVQSPQGGHKPIDNRTVFTSLAFFLKTGIGWRDLPTEMVASQCTVRRRLKAWTEAGPLRNNGWEAVTERLLAKLRAAGRLDVAEVLIDGGLVKSPHGGKKQDRTRLTAAAVAAS